MVELMIAVVITAVCLIMVLRVFSICTRAVSNMYNSVYAVSILEEKIEELKIKSIMENGLEPASWSEDVKKSGRSYKFTQEIVEWEKPVEEISEDEVEEPEEATGLCEVLLRVSWGSSGGGKSLEMKVILPAREFADEL